MSENSKEWLRPQLSLVAGACLLALSQGAGAFEIDTGNPDLKVRLDTTVRYNLGIRAKDCDVNICGNDAGLGDGSMWQSDRKFANSGDVVTNRIDLLPEFDFIYKQRHGFRVSAAAWYDAAYSNKLANDAILGPFGTAGAGNSAYNPYTKRYVLGPSGEFLDAFVFSGFDVGDVPVNFKLGQHNVYWGESLFSFVNGISYGQGPVDVRKAQATPGIEAKEVFKPINQLSANIDFTDRISLAGQYQFDWKPTLLPEGGTYWGAADFISRDGGGYFGQFKGILKKPNKEHGDWGLALKWRPETFDARLGFYYREYSEKIGQLVNDGGFNPSAATNVVGFDYSGPRAKMLGFSMGKQVGDLSVGTDLTYRKGASLTAVPFGTPTGAENLPRGNVFSGVVNAIAYLGKNSVYDSAALTAEVNFSRLQKISANPQYFYGEGYACASPSGYDGCVTKNAVGFAVNFEPKWFQVWDGVDVTAPLYLGLGLHGNSPVAFGTNEGHGSYSIGVSFDIQNQYTVSLAYNGMIEKKKYFGGAWHNNSSLGKYWDRDMISATFKTTF